LRFFLLRLVVMLYYNIVSFQMVSYKQESE